VHGNDLSDISLTGNFREIESQRIDLANFIPASSASQAERNPESITSHT